MFLAFEIRPHAGWGGMVISALLSILMAIVIASWPGISLVALGILLGVNFVSSGVGYVMVSRSSTAR